MIEEFNAASSHLRAALQRYLSACSAVQGCFIRGNVINSSVPQELVNRVGNELLDLDIYEANLKQARAAMSLSRNCLSTIVPINALPSEILGYIFQLVLDAQPCSLHGVAKSSTPALTDLDRLLHVCTRWRQVAVSSHTLWSHIDIAPTCSFSEGLLARAEAYAARAAHSLLDIHVISFDQDSARSKYTPLAQFLASVATRTRSLNLKAEAGSPTPIDFYHSIFQSCFVACPPGTFTQLSIEYYGGRFRSDSGFIGTPSEDVDRSNQLLALPQAHLEDIWLSIKVLHLTGLFPHWTSKAYHGLVDLRLLSDTTKITELQLVSVLTASPKLHTLHFGIKVTHSPPNNSPNVLVQLKDLEVLVWTPGSSTSDQLGTFLRWLAPGSKPLQMSIQNFTTNSLGENVPLSFGNEAKLFFARSNITKLHLRGWGVHVSMITELLNLMPSLQELALDRVGRARNHTLAPAISKSNAHTTCLDTLYLLASLINLDDLQQIIDRHPVQTLTLWTCKVYRNKDSKQQISGREPKRQLRTICPTVKLSESNPIQDWDFLVKR